MSSAHFNTTISSEEIDKSLKGCVPVNTAKSTNWVIRTWLMQRYKLVSQEAKELAGLAAEVGMDDFNQQMTTLNQIKENWIGDLTGGCLSYIKLLKTSLVIVDMPLLYGRYF